MAKRKSQSVSKSNTYVAESLHITHPHAAGIDVHAAEHWVAVPAGSTPPPPKDHPASKPAHVRPFGACTTDPEMLAWGNMKMREFAIVMTLS